MLLPVARWWMSMGTPGGWSMCSSGYSVRERVRPRPQKAKHRRFRWQTCGARSGRCGPDHRKWSDMADPIAGRRWRMHAGWRGDAFCNFGDPWYVRMYGHDPVEVELTENPDGSYWGFLYTEDRGCGPVMIQPCRSLFLVQFPYGPEQAIRQGEVVRMDCRQVDG